MTSPLRPALVLAAAFFASLASPASAGWWDEAAKARDTTLDEIAASPDRWCDVPASIVVRFGRALDVPAAPEFAAADWLEFTVSRGTSASSRGDSPLAGLVVRRGSAEAARIATLHEGDEVRLRAVVRSGRTAASGGRASQRLVLEVVAIAGASDALSAEELAALRRADELMAKDNAGAAEPLLRSVLDARTFVPAVRAELWRRIARAERSQKKLADAARSFRVALTEAPGDAAAARELAELERVLASTAARAAVQGGDAPAAPRALPTDASARASRPFAAPPAAAAPVEIPAPAVGPRLAPPRDRDGAPTATAPVTAAPPRPTAPSAPPALPTPTPPAEELLAPPPPKLAAPK